MRERNADGTFLAHKLGYKKKICYGCGRHLLLREYYKRAKSRFHPDGYDCRCKECRRKERRDWYERTSKVKDGRRINARGQAIEKLGNKTKLYWGEIKMQDFKRLYPVTKDRDLAIDFGCSMRTIGRRAKEYGLTKDPGWLTNVIAENRRIANAVRHIKQTKIRV